MNPFTIFILHYLYHFTKQEKTKYLYVTKETGKYVEKKEQALLHKREKKLMVAQDDIKQINVRFAIP